MSHLGLGDILASSRSPVTSLLRPDESRPLSDDESRLVIEEADDSRSLRPDTISFLESAGCICHTM